MTDQTPPEPVEVDGEGTADLHYAVHLLGTISAGPAALTGAQAMTVARAQLAAASAVVVQLQLVREELRQAREDAAADIDRDAVRWSDVPRLTRWMGEVAAEHHPADERRRDQLTERLAEVVERWATHR